MRPSACNHDKARRLRWAFLLLLLMNGACGRSSREVQGEFSRIARAIDGLRSAENEHKTQMIQPLRAAPCVHLCALRDGCIRAYETHIRALDLTERARSRTFIDSRALDEAELTLEKAKDLATQCAAEQAKLGRELSL